MRWSSGFVGTWTAPRQSKYISGRSAQRARRRERRAPLQRRSTMRTTMLQSARFRHSATGGSRSTACRRHREASRRDRPRRRCRRRERPSLAPQRARRHLRLRAPQRVSMHHRRHLVVAAARGGLRRRSARIASCARRASSPRRGCVRRTRGRSASRCAKRRAAQRRARPSATSVGHGARRTRRGLRGTERAAVEAKRAG